MVLVVLLERQYFVCIFASFPAKAHGLRHLTGKQLASFTYLLVLAEIGVLQLLRLFTLVHNTNAVYACLDVLYLCTRYISLLAFPLGIFL